MNYEIFDNWFYFMWLWLKDLFVVYMAYIVVKVFTSALTQMTCSDAEQRSISWFLRMCEYTMLMLYPSQSD